MTNFATHVFAVVRVKVLGTNFSGDPQELSDKVADAVAAKPSEWMSPVLGTVQVDGHGAYDIGAVEFADEVSYVIVDELDANSGRVVKERHFDANGNRVTEPPRMEDVVKEALQALEGHPEAAQGNTKVHFAMMRLKSLID